MTNKIWKATERMIAKRLGGRRVPITGRTRGSAPDVEHDWLSIEVKHRRVVPKWLRNAMDQACKSNLTGTKLPVSIIHEHGTNHDTDLVVMHLRDFEEWYVNES